MPLHGEQIRTLKGALRYIAAFLRTRNQPRKHSTELDMRWLSQKELKLILVCLVPEKEVRHQCLMSVRIMGLWPPYKEDRLESLSDIIAAFDLAKEVERTRGT